jgi:hypothetical protein
MLASLALLAIASTGQANREWTRFLGSRDPGGVYRAAACPDGRVYITNGLGRIVELDGRGVIIANRAGIREFSSVTALACDERARVYSAGERELAVFEPAAAADFRLVSREKAPVSISGMAPASDGTLYALGQGTPASLPLHALSPDGTLLYSFGQPRNEFIVPRRPPRGSLIWDGWNRRLLFLPGDEFAIEVYEAGGRLARIERPRLFDGRVTTRGAALLPEGDLAVQLTDGSLIVFGPAFDPVGEKLLPPRGTLIGASRDGALYFLDTGASGVRVTKARLEPSSSPAQRRISVLFAGPS